MGIADLGVEGVVVVPSYPRSALEGSPTRPRVPGALGQPAPSPRTEKSRTPREERDSLRGVTLRGTNSSRLTTLATTLAATLAGAQPVPPTLEQCLQNAARFMAPGTQQARAGSWFELTARDGCALEVTEHLGSTPRTRVYSFNLREMEEIQRPGVTEEARARITITSRSGAPAIRVSEPAGSAGRRPGTRTVASFAMTAVGSDGYLTYWNLNAAHGLCAPR